MKQLSIDYAVKKRLPSHYLFAGMTELNQSHKTTCRRATRYKLQATSYQLPAISIVTA